MKIAIIGAGNMGGAIARGLATGDGNIIVVSNPTENKLQALKADLPGIETTTDNRCAVRGADLVVLAVKPYILPQVVEEVKPILDYNTQAVISVVGGVDLNRLDDMLMRDGDLPTVMHAIPTTGALVGKSMTFLAVRRADEELTDAVVACLKTLGDVAVVDEKLMSAGTALCSCGIAYAFKYVEACVQAGVQLGFRPADALRYVVATIDGAMDILLSGDTNPQQEIDRVTTPGGMTIKGINELDHKGFPSAVISAILKPVEK